MRHVKKFRVVCTSDQLSGLHSTDHLRIVFLRLQIPSADRPWLAQTHSPLAGGADVDGTGERPAASDSRCMIFHIRTYSHIRYINIFCTDVEANTWLWGAHRAEC